MLGRTIDNLVAFGSPRVDPDLVHRVTLDLGRELEARLTVEEVDAARREDFPDVERSGDVELACDPSAVILAIRNLVTNAIAWSSKGSQVRVVLTGLAEHVEVVVEDQGPGVAPSERKRIFQPFVRGATAPERRAGYGLGLAIVAFVTERHGGDAMVEEAPGGGARFVIRLARLDGNSGESDSGP